MYKVDFDYASTVNPTSGANNQFYFRNCGDGCNNDPTACGDECTDKKYLNRMKNLPLSSENNSINNPENSNEIL